MLKINNLRRFSRPFLGGRFSFSGVWGFAGALFALVLALGTSGCGEGEKGDGNPGFGRESAAVRPDRLFDTSRIQDERVVEIRSIVGRDTLVRRFVLRDSLAAASGRVLPPSLAQATVLRVPLRRVVALSSSQAGYMLRLGVESRIVAVGEGRYVADSALYERVAAGQVAEVGNGNALSVEKLVALQPDLVMTFATGGDQDDYARLEALGIPLMLTSEWQDESPTAKAEWIKLYGILFDDGDGALMHRADSIYRYEKRAYDSLASLALPKGGGVPAGAEASGGQATRLSPRSPDTLSASSCPRVLAGMSYGGVWYAPGGKSYTARLIRDAGGCYLWARETTRELKLSMETVMSLADSADVWMNPGMFSTPGELLAADPRVKNIRAFRERRVFQNDGVRGPGEGNDFYEGAVSRPSELLRNVQECLRQARNPQNFAGSENSPHRWYRNIYIF